MMKSWLVIGAFSAAFTALLTLSTILAGTAGFTGFPAALIAWLTLWLPWIPLLPLALHAVRRLPLEASVSARLAAVHGAVLILIFLCHLGMGAAIHWTVTGMEGGLTEFSHAFLFERGALLFDTLVFGSLAASWNLRVVRDRLLEKRHDALLLGKHLSESRLQTLKMQLNPHFLFNTLNSVSVLVEKNDTPRALEMIGELSRFLRQTLGSSGEKWVTLARELEMVRRYLAIEKIRFGPRLSFHEECEPLALEARIPPMLLQPLFENAIVHGLAEKEGPCRLNFECRVHDRRVFMLISDNGVGFDASQDRRHGAGIGLANVEARLREIYGEDYSLSLEKAYPQGTLVAIKIPAYKDSTRRRENA